MWKLGWLKPAYSDIDCIMERYQRMRRKHLFYGREEDFDNKKGKRYW